MQYQNILAAVQNTVWAILPEKMDAICGFLQAKSAGMSIDAATIEKVAATNRTDRAPVASGSVGVIPIYGTISQRMDLLGEFSGGTSTERISKQFDAMMNDSSVSAIVLDIDSPGGNVYGTPELANKIFSARGTKPIIAQANSMMASAAFWIGAATDEIVVTPSGDIGSHGVLAVHFDQSKMNEAVGVEPTYIHYGKYKTEFSSDHPLTDDARNELQRRVDEVGEMFTKALAKYRGVSTTAVRNNFGQGRMFGPKEAIERGMANREATLEETIERLASGKKSQSRRRAAVDRRRLDLMRVS